VWNVLLSDIAIQYEQFIGNTGKIEMVILGENSP